MCCTIVFAIVVDAPLLMVLLKFLNDDDVEFMTAALIGGGTSIATSALVFATTMYMGLIGLPIGFLGAIAGFSVVVSSAFGVEWKRALLIAFIFMLVHFGIQIAIGMALLSA